MRGRDGTVVRRLPRRLGRLAMLAIGACLAGGGDAGLVRSTVLGGRDGVLALPPCRGPSPG